MDNIFGKLDDNCIKIMHKSIKNYKNFKYQEV